MGQRYRAVKAIVDYWHGILNRVPSSTILAVASHESGFNPNAFNQDHWGLMQVSPGTANDVAKDLTATGNPLIIQTLKRYDLSNPHTLLEPDLNLLLGIGYLNILAKAFDNDSDMVVAGYNRGRKGAQDLLAKIGKTGIAQLEYVRHVNSIRRQLESVA